MKKLIGIGLLAFLGALFIQALLADGVLQNVNGTTTAGGNISMPSGTLSVFSLSTGTNQISINGIVLSATNGASFSSVNTFVGWDLGKASGITAANADFGGFNQVSVWGNPIQYDTQSSLAQGILTTFSTGGIRWNNQANTIIGGSFDTGIYRNGAGVVEINNGTAGNLTATLKTGTGIFTNTVTVTNGFVIGTNSGFVVTNTGDITALGNLSPVLFKPWKRRQTWIQQSGNVINVMGDQASAQSTGTGGTASTAPTSTFGTCTTETTGATAGSPSGHQGNVNYRIGRNIIFNCTAQLSTNANQRVVFGISDGQILTHVNSDNLAGNYACFLATTNATAGYSSTAWVCMTKDNSTITTTITSSTVDVNPHKFTITFNDSVPNVVFAIDDSNVATNTTHLPTAGTNSRYVIGIQNTLAANYAINWEYITVDSDR